MYIFGEQTFLDAYTEIHILHSFTKILNTMTLSVKLQKNTVIDNY